MSGWQNTTASDDDIDGWSHEYPTETRANSSDKAVNHTDMAAVVDGCIRQIEGDPPGSEGEPVFHGPLA